MSTTTAPATASTTPACIEPVQRFVLEGVTWPQYVAISDAITPQRGLRITFDGERIELMTLSRPHERFKGLLARFIEVLTLELDMPLEYGGSMTLRSERIARGLESDECYWIAHAEEILGVDQWKPGLHPPPDLAIEVDVTSSSVDRQSIYAKLRVPELWRFDGTALAFLALNNAGEYAPVEHSLSFPFLCPADLLPYLLRDPPATQTKLVREFLEWAREQDFPRS